MVITYLVVIVFFICVCFETGCDSLLILLPHPLTFWDYRYESPHLAGGREGAREGGKEEKMGWRREGGKEGRRGAGKEGGSR